MCIRDRRRGTLTGSVWIDRNGDCVRQAEEELLSGVEVHLMDGAGRFITESTTTDENGRFAFARVAPGSYKLRVDAPEGYVFSGAAQDSVLPLESTRDGRGYSASFTMLGLSLIHISCGSVSTTSYLPGSIPAKSNAPLSPVITTAGSSSPLFSCLLYTS